jgi:hypothetical protein
MAMYQEAEKLAGEVLKVDPGDETAQANAMAARNSMMFRSRAMGRVMPLVLARPPLLRFRRKLTAARMRAALTRISVWNRCRMT